MLSRLLHTLRDHALCLRGDQVLVAVSGGPDSTALLFGLSRVAPRIGVRLRVATVDHGLRPESRRECESVVAQAGTLGIAGEILPVDVNAHRRPHCSLQEAAREVRLYALSEHAKATGSSCVALGHTADDQAETVLFRILRGTGVAGLAGIPYRRECFIRPLLDVRRAEILTFLTKRNIPFVTDPSNANPRFTRARIRHEVLPFLAKENPKITEALLALSRSAKEGRVDVPGNAPLSRGGRDTLARFQREARGTRSITVPGGRIRCSYGTMQFISGVSPAPLADQRVEVQVHGKGLFRLHASAGLILRSVSDAVGNVFDADLLSWPLVLRLPRPGDRMRPRGGVGRRKLSDLFIDAKIPRDERPTLPILCDGSGEILYVPRSRPSEFGRPNPLSRNLFVVEEAR